MTIGRTDEEFGHLTFSFLKLLTQTHEEFGQLTFSFLKLLARTDEEFGHLTFSFFKTFVTQTFGFEVKPKSPSRQANRHCVLNFH